MTEPIKVNFGRDYAEEYKSYSQSILEDVRNILRRNGIYTIPFIQSEFSDNSVSIFNSCNSKQRTYADNVSTLKKTDNYNNNNQKELENGAFLSVRDNYTNLITNENILSSQESLPSATRELQEDISTFVDEIEDNIAVAGQKNIDLLTQKLPESGRITGGIYYGVSGNDYGESTSTTKMQLSNSWQNKNKTFGIVASGSFSYEGTRTSELGFNYDMPEDNPELGEDNTSSYNENISDDIGNISRFEEGDLSSGDASSNEMEDDTTLQKIETVYNRKCDAAISVHARLDRKQMIYGAGISSAFHNNGTQIHNQNISILHKPTNMAGDLMRRTNVSVNPETKERIVRSQMKLKLNLVDNKSDLDEEFNSNTEEFNLASQETDIDNIEQPKEKKDGEGWDLDFEYDDAKCGFITQYGMYLINDKKKKTRLTVAPVVGGYDYTPQNDEDNEAVKVVLGGVTDFKKVYSNGARVDAQVYAANSRIMERGSKPSDTKYILFNGDYNSPKRNFNANVSAGTLKSDNISLSYVNASANYRKNNWNVGAQATYSNLTIFGEPEKDYEIGVKCAYDIPYKTKK